MGKRIIAHLDMDAFFASVEEQKRPHLKGKPIVVGSEIVEGVGRGVVSTANYKAREYGIHSAMAISRAWQASKEAQKQGREEVIFLPVDFALYQQVSSRVLEIIRAHSKIVEPASIDEFYFDLSFAKTFKKAEGICQKIKKEIKEKERVTCSVGIGPNKLIAKIAAGIKKPDGMYFVQAKDVPEFLNPLDVRELPGIGPKTAEFLYQRGVKIISDLLRFSRVELKEMMGKHGESIYDKARGIDTSPITEFREVKSIGEQTTLIKDTSEPILICDALWQVSNGVFSTFKKSDFTRFRTIVFTVRFADFETRTSSKSFQEGIGKDNKKKFELELLKLALPFLDARGNPKRKRIRLIGVRIEKLAPL